MIIWLAYVNYPITTAVYLERVLRQHHTVVTVGPRLPEAAIEAWQLQNMHLPLAYQDIDTSFTPDMAALLASIPPSEHPDLYLWVESVNGYCPENLDALTCPKACYLIDTHYHLEQAFQISKGFDYVFIAQLVDLEAFREVHPRVHWLPLGCDPDIHGYHRVEKLYDVGFVGSMNPRRQSMLDFLSETFAVHTERAFWRDMARVLSESRIVLNDASFDDLNMRFFEVMATGSLLLSNPTKGSGQDILFRDGEDYICHHDNDLLDKVRYYLDNDTLRERVAARGRSLVLNAHTYGHRVSDMMAVLFEGKNDTFSPEELRCRSLAGEIQTGLCVTGNGPLQDSDNRSEKIASPQIRSIITTRFSNLWPTWQMVHEWEDIFADELGAGLKPVSERCMVTDPEYGPLSYDLMFLQLADELAYYEGNRRLIPIVMDLWGDDFDRFQQRAAAFPLVYLTSLQAYREMMGRGVDNVRYLPFSVADRYLSWELSDKDIDIIHFGRRNPLLEGYMARLLERYPQIHYVTTDPDEEGKKVFIHSNRYGVLGESDSRDRFMHVLARSRISLVSTVGMDGSRSTGGIDPVSPRFLESMAAGCHLVGRIPENSEFAQLGVAPFCHHVNSYEEFETKILELLAGKGPDLEAYRRCLERHLTSLRVAQVRADIVALKMSEVVCLLKNGGEMDIKRISSELAVRLQNLGIVRSSLDSVTSAVNYRTIADVIGFYNEFWGIDLFSHFSTILLAQNSVSETLQYAALELKYRGMPEAAQKMAHRAMLLDPESYPAATLYTNILRENGLTTESRAHCLDLQRRWLELQEAEAILTMCDVDDYFPLAMEHYHLLHQAHRTLRPRRYLEIGVSNGKSLALSGSGTDAIGIDPMTAVPEQLFFHSPQTVPHLYKMTSNDFFQQGSSKRLWGENRFDMAFIDGLHIFEQALMDFINLEHRSSPSSIIFIHDCFPINAAVATRERNTMVWTGDVWKMIPCLKAVRPDLEIVTFPLRPSGIAMVRNLDSSSRVLINQFDSIVKHFIETALPESMDERCRLLNVTGEQPTEVFKRVIAEQGTFSGGSGA